MKRKLIPHATVVWTLALALACLMFWFAIDLLKANPDPDFWFVPLPPVPSYAMNVKNLDGGSLGGYRIIQFETSQPADEVRQFYRTELPKRGWYYLCSPTKLEQQGCPLGLSPVVELADAYKRDDEPGKVRAINVSILKPGENLVGSDNRLAEVVEYRYPLVP